MLAEEARISYASACSLSRIFSTKNKRIFFEIKTMYMFSGEQVELVIQCERFQFHCVFFVSQNQCDVKNHLVVTRFGREEVRFCGVGWFFWGFFLADVVRMSMMDKSEESWNGATFAVCDVLACALENEKGEGKLWDGYRPIQESSFGRWLLAQRITILRILPIL